MAYATVEELESRWRQLNESEQTTAGTLLEDAATYLNAFVTVDLEDEQQVSALRMVSCSMVRRAMSASDNDAFGVSEQTISADIYSQRVKWENPTGDLYLTASEKRLLGITGSYLVNIRPVIEPVEVRRHDTWGDC